MPKKSLPTKDTFQDPQNNLLEGSDVEAAKGRLSAFSDFIPPKNVQQLRQYSRSPQFVMITQITVIVTSVLVFTSLFLHFSLNRTLRKSEEEIMSKIQTLESLDVGFLDLSQIAAKIALHKDYKQNLVHMSPILQLFMSTLDKLEYKSFSLTGKNITITSLASSPLAFSQVTSLLLESDLVDQVILKSASLEKSSQKYNLGLEIILK
ncbi:MAG TPA: hypothetical protein PLT50_00350 [bacterium]|nr:hypothetical protein [bacterium]